MKKFRGFVIKEFYHIFRDVRTMLILFGMPAVQLLLFGYVITNEIRDARIAVLDQSHDQVTRRLTEKIVSSGYFHLDKNLNGFREIEPSFRHDRVKLVVVFGPDFEKNLEKTGKARVQLIGDASDPNTASILVSYASGIITSFVAAENIRAGMPMQISPEVRMLYNPGMKGVYMFVPGIMAMLMMLICALMTSISITREKEMGTMELLLVSPLKPFQVIIGKVIPYVLIAFADAVIILLMANFVFGVPIQGNVILLLAECLLYILMALSLGILISTITDSQQVAMMLSLVVLMLPTILLSGFVFPIENMPMILQWLCQIMPPKYFIIIIKNIMIKGTDFSFVWKETLILLGMTLFFLALSVKKFKTRLE